MQHESGEVTILLRRMQSGDESAAAALLPLVYNELRKIARAKMRPERDNHTLQPTALVHEAYLRLIDQRRVEWRDRAHFYGVAAQTMRRVLVDHARTRLASKRGGGALHLQLEPNETLGGGSKLEEILFVNDAVDRLGDFDPKQAKVVEMRYFGGMTMQETADALGVSRRTVQRDWAMAKSWLQRELAQTPLER